MKKLFGTNGVRGVFSEDFTLEFVNDLVMSMAAYFKQGKILVGYDGRHSSPIVAKIVSSALNYSGLDCYMAGLVPTPCLEYATRKLGYDGGLMITASHNPPQYNGIKLVASDGVEISREDERKIEQIFDEKNWIKTETFGKSYEETSVISTYIDGITSVIDTDSIKAKKFKVCLDLGNGAQAVTAKKLCENLGCDVYTINEEIDGDFPGRGSEPTPQNLHELSKLVVDTNSNFGIAFREIRKTIAYGSEYTSRIKFTKEHSSVCNKRTTLSTDINSCTNKKRAKRKNCSGNWYRKYSFRNGKKSKITFCVN